LLTAGVIDYWGNLKRYAIANLAYWCLKSRKERMYLLLQIARGVYH